MLGGRAANQTSSSGDGEIAQVMLYVAGEMSADERAAFERRLAVDADLRARVETLRSTQAAIGARLSAADALEPIDFAARASERAVSRAMRQWQVDRVSRAANGRAAAQIKPAERWRFRRAPIWLYPLTAAASVLLILGIWSLVLRPVAPPLAKTDGVGAEIDPVDPLDVEDKVLNAVAAAEQLGDLGADFDANETMLADAGWNPLSDVGGETLASLEREYESLQVLEYSMNRTIEPTP